MKVVVQKFGGTCVESEENQLLSAERIMEARDRGLHPVVVVSAMGREGQPYSTAELVKMVTRIHPHIEPRELDLLMSCGEIVSTVAMAHLLATKGYETIAFSGGQAGLVTDGFHGSARIVRIEPDPLLRALQDGYVVFVAGFQGNTRDHQITTLGAGGSDYTAVALTWVIQETPQLPFGEKLEMAPLQIYKEVDGVMTANPGSLPEGEQARTIPSLTYDECVWMSRLGAEVLQQQAAEMAREHRIPLSVRDYRHAESQGTQVGISTTAAGDDRATAIADQARLAVFDVETRDHRLVLQTAERLDRERLTHYQLSAAALSSAVARSAAELESGGPRARFAVRPLKYRDVRRIVEGVLAARGVRSTLNVGDFALVSVVGEALRQRLEAWADQAARVLADGKVAVHGQSQDDISLSYLVSESQRQQAVGLLHRALVL
jgi:aspartate kinase